MTVQARIYLAGPMTGLDEHNFPAFREAARKLEQAGWAVVNPADNFGGRTDLPRSTYLRIDVALLMQCDAMAVLPGWEESEGARLEYLLARGLRIPVIDVATMQLLANAPDPSVVLKRHDPGPKRLLSTNREQRKQQPIARGVLDYFPDAVAAVAHCSYIGNKQHNPDEPLRWARGKSADHADCIARHLIDRGTVDADGVRHSTKVAWRALAMLQIELEATNAITKEAA